MNCPVCQRPLKTIQSRGYTLDVCLGCSGIWFDQCEFLGFAKQLEENVTSTDKLTLFKPRQVVSAKSMDREIRLCPQCNSAMKQFNYAYDSNIILDRCTQCEGVWTDAGEIQRVAVHLKKDPRVAEIGSALIKKKPYEDVTAIADVLNSPMPYIAFAPRIILPLYDDQPIQRFPWMTLGLIAGCSLAFSYMFFFVDNIKDFADQFFYTPTRLVSLGVLTSILLHGSWLHLVGNMYYLWLFGDNIEDRLGPFKFILFYLGAGLFANLFYALFNSTSATPLVGASGAISGVMGAYLMYYPSAKIKTLIFYRIMDVPVVVYLGFWIILQIISGAFDTAGTLTGVACLAHIGGFLFGIVFALIDKCLLNRKMVQDTDGY